jgi:hypothetical protein
MSQIQYLNIFVYLFRGALYKIIFVSRVDALFLKLYHAL